MFSVKGSSPSYSFKPNYSIKTSHASSKNLLRSNFSRNWKSNNFSSLSISKCISITNTTSPKTSSTIFKQTVSLERNPISYFKRYYSDYPDHASLDMPALSPTMEAGSIKKWYFKEGDMIKGGDKIASIETDKAVMDWESVDDGYLAKIIYPDGSNDVPVGAVVAILVSDKASIAAFANYSEGKSEKQAPAPTPAPEPTQAASKPAASSSSSSPPPPPAPSSSAPAPQNAGGRVFASPAARAAAASSGKDLTSIQGTGPNNRIIKADVLEATSSVSAVAASAPTGATYTDIPNSKIRKVTASRLTQSKQTIPHYYLTIDFSVDKLQKLRSELNALSKDYKLSVNDFVIKASALALKSVPEVNSQWNDTSIRRFHDIHINVAVNTDQGLYTPILPFTDRLGLRDISNSVKTLADKAHGGSLSLADLEIGTFTISNLGMFGIKHFNAVINPPQACILAVGGIEQRVVVNENRKEGDSEYKVSNYMSVSLSCDHRVVDGAIGANWLKSFKGYMENPMTLLL